LAVIPDACSRKVGGYAVGDVLDACLPLAALEAALESRRPPPRLVNHSDRGVQYASRRCRKRLAEAGPRGSMSRTGNLYHNAQVESSSRPCHEEVFPARLRHRAGRHRPTSAFLRSTTENASTLLWAIDPRRSTRPCMPKPQRRPIHGTLPVHLLGVTPDWVQFFARWQQATLSIREPMRFTHTMLRSSSESCGSAAFTIRSVAPGTRFAAP